ncbi:hypothetical protein BU23DRAFT_663969 [Bimuria novae-zelandiae CBS 107.79]|uniref:Ecp2 effector protein domain-containing protein n=1 Tax=Bimuria novae-zelandiae CBS 107.79 TaxID=1447943 RepID=A0A6A5UMF3_9PLEO|nr:hypothetical protein BU23DRAFT_663969 [Bimuria novae-zelandiae CBS 107.79]
MRFTTLHLLTLTVTLSTSFRFTPSMPDGVYSVYTAANGTEIYDLIAPDTSTTDAIGNPISVPPQARALRALTARSIIACGCGVGMDHGDTDKANSNIQKTVSNGKTVQSGGSLSSKVGSSVVFFCNYDGSDTTARKDEAISGASAITGACGWYIAGTIRLDGHPHLDYGYMGARNDFCAHAEDSGLRHC